VAWTVLPKFRCLKHIRENCFFGPGKMLPYLFGLFFFQFVYLASKRNLIAYLAFRLF